MTKEEAVKSLVAAWERINGMVMEMKARVATVEDWGDETWEVTLVHVERLAGEFASSARAIRSDLRLDRPVGRPKVPVNVDAVKKVNEQGMTIAAIARRLGCSRNTIYRAMRRAEREAEEIGPLDDLGPPDLGDDKPRKRRKKG